MFRQNKPGGHSVNLPYIVAIFCEVTLIIVRLEIYHLYHQFNDIQIKLYFSVLLNALTIVNLMWNFFRATCQTPINKTLKTLLPDLYDSLISNTCLHTLWNASHCDCVLNTLVQWNVIMLQTTRCHWHWCQTNWTYHFPHVISMG